MVTFTRSAHPTEAVNFLVIHQPLNVYVPSHDEPIPLQHSAVHHIWRPSTQERDAEHAVPSGLGGVPPRAARK